MQPITAVKANGYRNGAQVNDKEYKVLNNTYFDADTPDKLVYIIDELLNNKKTVKIFFGDPATGKNWNEEHNTIGRIGRSTGTIKIPLLVNARSNGGPALMTDRILKIRDIKAGKSLYQASNFNHSHILIVPSEVAGYTHSVTIDGQIYSNHKTERSAKLLRAKLS